MPKGVYIRTKPPYTRTLKFRQNIGKIRKGKTYEEVYGTEKAKKWKERLSDFAKTRIGAKNSFYGRHHIEESNRMNAEKHYGKAYHTMPHTEETKIKIRKMRLKQVFPIIDTVPELSLQKALFLSGIEFTKHKPIENFVQCDIFIAPNIVIFVDGCYWHGCEQCSDKNKMSSWIRGRKTADLLITQRLVNVGYVVLRFWEHEIHENLEECVEKISQSIKFMGSRAVIPMG